jgi:hypothetical protein
MRHGSTTQFLVNARKNLSFLKSVINRTNNMVRMKK